MRRASTRNVEFSFTVLLTATSTVMHPYFCGSETVFDSVSCQKFPLNVYRLDREWDPEKRLIHILISISVLLLLCANIRIKNIQFLTLPLPHSSLENVTGRRSHLGHLPC